MLNAKSNKTFDRKFAYKLWVFGIWLIGLGLVQSSFNYYYSIAKRKINPASAYLSDPSDPANVAAYFNYRLKTNGPFSVRGADEYNLMAAIRLDPLNRQLLRTAGISADLEGDMSRAYAFMQQANLVSRRDSITQLWLGEYFRQRKYYAKSLSHFDAAIRVNSSVRALAFQVNIPHLAERQFRDSLVLHMSNDGGLASEFLIDGIPSQLSSLKALILENPEVFKSAAYSYFRTKMFVEYAKKRSPQEVLLFGRSVFPGFNEQEFVQSGWEEGNFSSRYGELAWSSPNYGGASISRLGLNKLRVTVPGNGAVSLLSRHFAVNGGASYQVSHLVELFDLNGSAELRWLGECRLETEYRTFWSAPVSKSIDKSEFSELIRVPIDCNYIRLTLNGSNESSEERSEINVAAFSFVAIK